MKRIAILWALLALAPMAVALPITVTNNNLQAFASDPGSSPMSDVSSNTGFPQNTSLSATSGLASSRVTANWSGTAAPGGNALLSFDLAQAINNVSGTPGGSPFDLAQAFDNSVEFTANIDATYDISGNYMLTGPAGVRISFQVLLTGSGGALFNSAHESRNTANESFTVGTVGGETSSVTGSSNGTLIAGESYVFFFQAIVQSRDDNDQSTLVAGSANGNLVLAINEIPEPASLLLVGVGALIAGRRRQRSA